MRDDCIFCDIVAGNTPAEKVYEDDRVLAFLDINPISEGHTLIIPKKHYPDIFEIPSHELCELSQTTKKISKSLRISLNAKGVNVLHNSGTAAQQEVPHFHIHVIPRYRGDQINIFPERKQKKGDLNKIAEKIRKRLQ
ncbi:MAG: HIT family protein [Candidatus Korarchaeota archaeon]|nr:HIT family protein [Candidatus Korarchaeota archaeon]NIU82878.1 HIT domain-containing protein [Candidatus Thorarchaeota archaeon]NIW12572.1 HIT domain-containing protein [Candidatus Thorarchaeota archaeon]NIW50792.1 HIT domain-containing protein [Candidatus Korarchaeota archaeon]